MENQSTDIIRGSTLFIKHTSENYNGMSVKPKLEEYQIF